MPLPLRVASYNIHRAVGSDRRRDTHRIAAVIRELDADVIGLQEVDWHHDHSDPETQFEYLAHLPGFQAVAGANLRDHRGHYGNLLLTRLAVARVRRIDLSQSRRERRGAIEVELGEKGWRLRVIVTHLGLGLRERWRQAARLHEIIADRPGQPTLLLGDFNEWLPGNPSLGPLRRLCHAAACPASYPSVRPILALDRILACAMPWPLSIRAHATPLARKASDHLPIVADIGAGASARS
ncbi:MAG: endonuclease/exonuclease/phosphatase family protein [Kiloniellales bacterium]